MIKPTYKGAEGMTVTLKLPLNLAPDLQGVQLVDFRGKLPVNPHYTWEQKAGTRAIETLTTIVCHHDAWPKSVASKYTDIQLAEKIARDHINSKVNHPTGDPGFPYDLWLRNGVIYWCNDIETREYGVRGNNGFTVNVCVSGDYKNYDTLTQVDRKALYVAIIMLQEALPNDQFIKGHGEIVPTSCPGYDMNRVRAELLAYSEQISYNANKESDTKIYEMIKRIGDLYDKHRTPNHEHKSEADRKLTRVYDILYAEGWMK